MLSRVKTVKKQEKCNVTAQKTYRVKNIQNIIMAFYTFISPSESEGLIMFLKICTELWHSKHKATLLLLQKQAWHE